MKRKLALCLAVIMLIGLVPLAARNAQAAIPEVVNPESSTLLFITLAHIFARFISVLAITGGVKVNVNLYSARHSSSDNILACDFIDGSLADVVKAQPVTLHCGLITENAKTALKP